MPPMARPSSLCWLGPTMTAFYHHTTAHSCWYHTTIMTEERQPRSRVLSYGVIFIVVLVLVNLRQLHTFSVDEAIRQLHVTTSWEQAEVLHRNHTMSAPQKLRYRDLVPSAVVEAFPKEQPIYCNETLPLLAAAPSTFILMQLSRVPEVTPGTTVSYLWDCIKQIRLFNPKANIVFLMDQEFPWQMSAQATKEFDLIVCAVPHPIHQKTRKHDHRFQVIGSLMKQLDLRNVWHLEFDNMLYTDFTNLTQTASRLFEEVASTPLGSVDFLGPQMTGGLMFFKDYLAAEALGLYSWERILKRDIIRNLDRENNDMTDLGAIQQRQGTRFLANLPILPYGKFSRYAKSFGSIFDAAGYGQFLDGIGRAAAPGAHSKKGWTGSHHYIGDGFIHGLIELSWKQDEESRWYPVVTDTKTKRSYRLNNLHMYTKHLSEFTSSQSSMPAVPSMFTPAHTQEGKVREWHIHEVWSE